MTYSVASDISSLLNTPVFTSTTDPTDSMVNSAIVDIDNWIDNISGHSWTVNLVTDELCDPIPSAPRGSMIIPRFKPLLSVIKAEYWQNNIWTAGINALPDDPVAVNQQSYLVYLDRASIIWDSLRLTGRQNYRISYTWGYLSTPGFINDLSTYTTAVWVLDHWAGKILPAEAVSEYRKRFTNEINGFMKLAGIRTGTYQA